MPARARTLPRQPSPAESSRLLPLLIAGLLCFLSAFILGTGSWYFFGSHRRAASGEPTVIVQTPAPPVRTEPAPTPSVAPVHLAPAGELAVAGGEVVLGGEGTDQPLKRDFVNPFFIAETEVTNEQYREFVQATKHQPPASWKNQEYPPGTGAEPVTGVAWQDAVDYCKWLSEQIGANARLPTEAEWELAARGKDGFKYPWGNEWNPRAAVSRETKGSIRPVKSFAENKSPVGAFDMAGNVWEWVADEAQDVDGKPKLKDGVAQRVIKGGSFDEPQAFISATARYEVPATLASSKLGFRYIVVREKEKPSASP